MSERLGGPAQAVAEAADASEQSSTAPVLFDLVISGGGMTGALLALVAAEQNPALRIAVIEQSPAQPQGVAAGPGTGSPALQAPTASFDSRSIALSAASVELLDSFGLWSSLKADACAIESILVSDQGHFGKTRLSAAEYQRRALGYVIEIEYIGAALYQRLAKPALQQTIRWFRPARIASLAAPTDANWRWLTLTDGTVLQTRLLVLAEGGDAPGRSLAGIATAVTDYQQTALIANVAIRGSHQQRAYERFTADGPVALLPLPAAADGRQRYSLVWTLPDAVARQRAQSSESLFLQALQRIFAHRAGEFVAVGNRVCYPLQLKRAASASAHRLVLCGNSLHNLHPIAGQGFNLALRDIAALHGLLARQQDVGAYALTRQYAQLREADMATVITLTDSLVRLFSNHSKLLALGRSVALSTLNHSSVLKTLFARQTMGLTPVLRQQMALADAAAALSGSPALPEKELP